MAEPDTTSTAGNQILSTRSIYAKIKDIFNVQVGQLRRNFEQDQHRRRQAAIALYSGHAYLEGGKHATSVAFISVVLPIICSVIGWHYILPLVQLLSQILGHRGFLSHLVTLSAGLSCITVFLLVMLDDNRPEPGPGYTQLHPLIWLPFTLAGFIFLVLKISGVFFVFMVTLDMMIFIWSKPVKEWWHPLTLLDAYLLGFGIMEGLITTWLKTVDERMLAKLARMEAPERWREIEAEKVLIIPSESSDDAAEGDEEGEKVDFGVGEVQDEDTAPEGSLAAELAGLGEVIDETED